MTNADELRLECSTNGVAACLGRMGQLVTGSGGYFHPGALVEEHGGQLRVRRGANVQTGETLFHLPDAALIPVGGLTIHGENGRITGYTMSDVLSDTRRALLDTLIELFNLCGKLGQYPAVPGSRLSLPPSWLTAVHAIKPEFSPPPEDPVAGLLQTRLIRNFNTANGFAPGHYLMPVMELLNHRSGAPRFGLGGGAIAITAWTPDDSDECFASYAEQLDPLDLALHYGHADPTNLLAHSAPICVDLPGVGRIDIGAPDRRPSNALNAPQVSYEDGPIHLSHLTFDAASPQRSRAVLALVLSGLARQRGLDGTKIKALLEAAPSILLAANLAPLSALEAAGSELAEQVPGAREIGVAAGIQARNLARVLGPDVSHGS